MRGTVYPFTTLSGRFRCPTRQARRNCMPA